ncbi:514_t:CDS:2 [Gigaspora margarita]|uniref:514_t:CDS:1 n=1 Tax=Gigaspora margarita TaxID=4874 RepID=A0ABN7WAG7_GIGMA|nr:514_t:CDS:2 [Gigaspora margarita]
MPSHVALLVVIISVKSGSLCSSGLAKYKLTKEMSRRFNGKKYMVENFDQCLTVAYANILDSGNPNRKFDTIDVSICFPHCMFSVTVTHNPKQVDKFIHFGIECVEYNSVTSTPNVKMPMMVLYPSKSMRFQKYLGPTGSNIKLNNTYLILGLIRFLTSGKIMIEATDIDFLKTLNVNYSTYESSSTVPGIWSIFDIIADDVDFITTQTLIKHEELTNSLVENNITTAKLFKSSVDINTSAETSSSYKRKKPYNQPDYINLDAQSNEAEMQSGYKFNDKQTACLDEEENLQEASEEEENNQTKKRKISIKTAMKKKDKINRKNNLNN